MKVVRLTVDQVRQFWPDIEPFIARALEFDLYESITTNEVALQISQGYAHVLVIADGEDLIGATVTQLLQRKDGNRVVHVLTTAGERAAEFLPVLVPELERLAREENAGWVSMSGRPGWAKLLGTHGFKIKSVDMALRVDDEQREEPEPLPVIQ